jgi:hypothetical protein
MYKKSYLLTFVMLFFLFISGATFSTVQAQKSNKTENAYDFKEHLWYGFNIGGLSLGSNTFSVGLAPMGGYKITDYLAVGLTTKFSYTYFWQRLGDNYHFFDYGGGALARVQLFKGKYFIQTEYDYISIKDFNVLGIERNWYPFFYIGGGIRYPGNNNWSSELTLLFNLHQKKNKKYYPFNISYAFLYNL